MTSVTNALANTLGLVVLATGLILINSWPVRAEEVKPKNAMRDDKDRTSEPVRVVNTPLPVQGTVSAMLIGTSPVSLSTTPTTPVFVDADRPARNGFNASCATGNVDSTFGQASCALLTIPPGRQVVIESISCQAELVAGQGPGDVQLIVPNVPFGGGPVTNVSHLLALSKQAGNSSVDIWRMTTPLRAYGGAPATGSVSIGVFFRANFSATQTQGIVCAISGYEVGE